MPKRPIIMAAVSLAILTGCVSSETVREFKDAAGTLFPDKEDTRSIGAMVRSIMTDIRDSLKAGAGRTAAIHGKGAEKTQPVLVTKSEGLNIYTPEFQRMDLVTGTMPSKEDTDVILVCEAAFTGELLTEFKHSNIAGHHVGSGEFHKGFKCGPNNGVFTWSSESGWHFYNLRHADSEAVLREVAAEGGMGFCQSLLFLDGKRFKGGFKADQPNRYRALCEYEGKLRIIDCADYMPWGDFMDALEKIGVTSAIYCDMGPGWNYSWYRRGDGSVKEIFSTESTYTTNWVTFYSK